jgi:hypothetical protein
MITTTITRPLTPGATARPMVAGGVAANMGHCCLPWPGTDPWDPCDSELDRLRRLERAARREQEKEEIRRRLRQMGIPEERITGRRPFPCIPLPLPMPPAPPAWPLHPLSPRLPALEDIIQVARQKRSGMR